VLALGVFAAIVVGYGLLSRPLGRAGVTAPIVFVAAGMVAHAAGLGALVELRDAPPEVLRFSSEIALVVAELALALVLFSDAAGVDLGSLRRRSSLSTRLLGIGMPLTVVAGMAIAVPLFSGQLALWEAAIVAVVLAPTDAALGAAVFENPRLPVRIREALNVESGLNDGLAVPALFLFVALADATQDPGEPGYWVGFAARQIGLGVVVGGGLAYVGTRLVLAATRRGWLRRTFARLVPAALALLVYAAADRLGGSGFIAAFVGGLVAGAVAGDEVDVNDFLDEEGRFLTFAVFFVFGGLAANVIAHTSLDLVVYALLSLTVVRMVPVAIALVGTRLHAPTVAFIGWFGPRGLASIILAAVAVVDLAPALPGAAVIVRAMVVTVLLSIVAHGVTAGPLSSRLGRYLDGLPKGAADTEG